MESCRVRGLWRVASHAGARGLQQKPPPTLGSHLWWLQIVRGGSRQVEGEEKSKGEGKVMSHI